MSGRSGGERRAGRERAGSGTGGTGQGFIRRLAALAAAGVMAAGAVPGAAQDDAAETAARVEPIVVTATRIPEKVSEVAASVSVVGEEEIREKGTVHVGDAIRDLPSVSVQRLGQPGTLESVRIRGADANQVLVMIDGIPLNTPSSGDVDLADLLTAGVERIEVVRGAQSALYGSNAVGGVVNIITKKATGRKEFRYSVEAGSHRTANNVLGLYGGGPGLSLGVDAALSASAGERDNDDYRNRAVNLRLAARPSDGTTVSVLTMLTDSHKDLPVEVTFDPVTFQLVQHFDPDSSQRRFFTLFGGTVSHEAGKRTSFEFRTALQREILENTDGPDPGDAFPLNTRSVSEKRFAEARATIRAASWNTLIAGGQYNGDFTVFSGDAAERAMHNRALFVQDEIRAGRHLVASAGVRYDDHSFAGSRLSPRAALALRNLPGGLTWRASYGSGFRSPTLVDLFFPFFGNTALRPETARSYETGLAGRFFGGRVSAEADWFYLRFRDLIEADPSTGFQAANIGKAFSRGVEFQAEAEVAEPLVLGGRYTYQEAMNQSDGTELLRRPRNRYHAYARLRGDAPFSARVDVAAASSARGLSVVGLPERNPGWHRVDLSASYSLPQGSLGPGDWRLTARIGNLLDRKYSEVEGFPSPRFHVLVGAEARI